MSSDVYWERNDKAKAERERELSEAVAEAVEELVGFIESTASKLRSSFELADVSPEIDNT